MDSEAVKPTRPQTSSGAPEMHMETSGLANVLGSSLTDLV